MNKDICFHRFGNNVNIQIAKTNHQESSFQKLGLMSISRVLAFKISVKNIIERANEPVINNGLCIHFSCTLQPIIIGRSGKTQGASMVNMPAKKDASSSSIIIYLTFYLFHLLVD